MALRTTHKPLKENHFHGPSVTETLRMLYTNLRCRRQH